MYIINLFLATTVYMISIAFGFYLSGYTYKELTHEEVEEENKKEQKMIEHMELLNFQHLYEDEFNDLSLNEVDIETLKNKYVELEVPLNKVIMFYDSAKDSFSYYTQKGDVLYKYLNVVCRKFIIEYNCKQLYKDGFETLPDERVLNIDNCFSKKYKPKPKTESKLVNRFIHLGTIDDYYESKKVVSKNNLSFMDYFSRN